MAMICTFDELTEGDIPTTATVAGKIPNHYNDQWLFEFQWYCRERSIRSGGVDKCYSPRYQLPLHCTLKTHEYGGNVGDGDFGVWPEYPYVFPTDDNIVFLNGLQEKPDFAIRWYGW